MILKMLIAVLAIGAFLAWRSYEQYDARMDALVACSQAVAAARVAGEIPEGVTVLC